MDDFTFHGIALSRHTLRLGTQINDLMVDTFSRYDHVSVLSRSLHRRAYILSRPISECNEFSTDVYGLYSPYPQFRQSSTEQTHVQDTERVL